MKILVVCPTITGREEGFLKCVEDYKRTLQGHDVDFINPLDRPSWGVGINDALIEAHESEGSLEQYDYIHLTSDDIEPHDGWLDAAVEALGKGMYPAPLLLNPDGSVAGFGHGDANMMDTSTDWKPTLTSVVPTITPIMWRLMGPMIPIMYFTDDYLSHRARNIGMPTVAVKAYSFTHHHSDVLPTVDGMKTRQERLRHDHVLYQLYLSTGKWPEGES
jgi:hypothetical protein